MPTVHAGWDWFYALKTDEERALLASGKLCAIVREDGDDNAAIVQAVKGVDAPGDSIRLETLNPYVGDCFLAIAWDSRACDVVMSDSQDDED